MAVVTDRNEVLDVLARTREAKAVMPLLCVANTYEIQANLEVVRQFALEHGIKNPPVGISTTFDYESMKQSRRFFSSLGGETEGMALQRSEAGLQLMFATLDILCGPEGLYSDILAVPHLDHADAEREEWVWNRYANELGTVMVDASLGDRSLEENIRLTRKMVEKYGGYLVIEGALQRPAVEGQHEAGAVEEDDAAYARDAKDYVDNTGVDMIVVELGSAQQSVKQEAKYNSGRARMVSQELGRSMIVLHGGSSIPLDQQKTLGDDGVLRFNQWTRTAREGAIAAAVAVSDNIIDVLTGDSRKLQGYIALIALATPQQMLMRADILKELLGDAITKDPSQAYFTRYSDAHFNQQVETLKAVLEALNYQRYAV